MALPYDLRAEKMLYLQICNVRTMHVRYTYTCTWYASTLYCLFLVFTMHSALHTPLNSVTTIYQVHSTTTHRAYDTNKQHRPTRSGGKGEGERRLVSPGGEKNIGVFFLAVTEVLNNTILLLL